MYPDDGNVFQEDEIKLQLSDGWLRQVLMECESFYRQTFSISPPANPTTKARPFHAMHLSDSGKGEDERFTYRFEHESEYLE